MFQNAFAHLEGTEVHSVGWAIRYSCWPKPEAEVGASCAGVVAELVVRIDNPEAGRVDIGVEQGVGHPCEDGQVVLDLVVHLNTIFKEEGETLDVVGNIVFNCCV